MTFPNSIVCRVRVTEAPEPNYKWTISRNFLPTASLSAYRFDEVAAIHVSCIIEVTLRSTRGEILSVACGITLRNFSLPMFLICRRAYLKAQLLQWDKCPPNIVPPPPPPPVFGGHLYLYSLPTTSEANGTKPKLFLIKCQAILSFKALTITQSI